MTKNYRYNLEETRGMVFFEGLGYTVLHLQPREIIMPGLQELWERAQEALQAIQEYLKEERK